MYRSKVRKNTYANETENMRSRGRALEVYWKNVKRGEKLNETIRKSLRATVQKLGKSKELIMQKIKLISEETKNQNYCERLI